MAGALSGTGLYSGAPGDVISPYGAGDYSNPAAGFMNQYMMGLPQGDPGGAPPSALTQQLLEMSNRVMPSDDQFTGALSSVQSAREKAVADKMAAIDRASAVLKGLNNGLNVPLMKYAGAIGRPGPFINNIGASADAYADATVAERERQQQMANSMLNLDVTRAGLPEQAAQQNIEDIYAREKMATTAAQDAAMSQYRDNSAAARIFAAKAQMAGRLGTADIQASKGRWKYIGQSPSDPNTGVYQDTQTGDTKFGPGAQQMHTTAFQQRYEIAKKLTDDPAQAYNLAIGKTPITDQALQQSASKLATEQLDTLIRAGTPPDDPKQFVTDTTKQYIDQWKSAGAATHPASPAGGVPAKPTAPVVPLPPVNERIPGKTKWLAPDGTVHTWTGSGWK